MNILLPAAGYNCLWQYGVLKRLSEDKTYWNNVDRLFGISGGSIAITLLYTLPQNDSHPDFDLMYDFFSGKCGKCWTWEQWVKDSLDCYNSVCDEERGNPNLSRKESYFGVSKVSTRGISFEWKEIQFTNMKECIKLSVASGSIPYVTVKPSKFNFKNGFDGYFTFRPKHAPFPNEDAILMLIASDENDLNDINSKYHITLDKDKKVGYNVLSKEEIKFIYTHGRRCADRFLNSYNKTVQKSN